jgi:hypothetical protein
MSNFDLAAVLSQLSTLSKDQEFHWESIIDTNTLEYVFIAWKAAKAVVAIDPPPLGDPESFEAAPLPDVETIEPESHQIRIPFNQREAVLSGLEEANEPVSGEFIFLIYKTLRKEVNDTDILEAALRHLKDYMEAPGVSVAIFKDVNTMQDTFTFFTKDTNRILKRLSIDWRN